MSHQLETTLGLVAVCLSATVQLAGSLEEIGCTPPESEEEGDDADEDDETKEMKSESKAVAVW